VPTGNFGDVFAGYVAAKMGLPIAKLIVATNVNDILHRALSSGDYSTGTVTPTAAPSMDIQVSSNFERLLADLGRRARGRSDARVRGGAGDAAHQRAARRRFALFASDRIDSDDERGDALGACRGRSGDRSAHRDRPRRRAPRRSAGRRARGDAGDRAPRQVRDAVERATGMRPPVPARIGDLHDRRSATTCFPARSRQ
jgi:threonine synthase